MKTVEKQTSVEIQVKEHHISDFLYNFCPWGSLDIRSAIQWALNAGQTPGWAAEQINDYREQTDAKMNDVDPVYCVLEGILQHARGKIEDVTGYDFINHQEQGEIYTYGNFMASSFDYPAGAITELHSKIKRAKAKRVDFDEMTLFFLKEIGITLK